MPIGVDEEHKMHVPIQGKHVRSEATPYSFRWYKERGIHIPPDSIWTRIRLRLRRLFLWWNYK